MIIATPARPTLPNKGMSKCVNLDSRNGIMSMLLLLLLLLLEEAAPPPAAVDAAADADAPTSEVCGVCVYICVCERE